MIPWRVPSKKNGFKPEDITDVILTHLHFDHCGGSIKYAEDGKSFELAFPNATYWTSREQYNWATDPNHREAASYLKRKYSAHRRKWTLKID